MICKVIDTIEKFHQLENVRTVCVGVSGGADSMCLLDILIKLKAKYDIIIKAVHVNHNLRGEEALRDENAVRKYCENNGVELTVFSEDIRKLSESLGIGEEECGRKIRYARFSSMNTDVVATAHTLSDSIETMLFNLSRGTGLKGLCSIPPKREPNIIRPLIECSGEETKKYCIDNHIQFVTDSTNLQDEYSRNFIRHNIVPLFSKVNVGYENNFARCLNTLYEENDFLEKSAIALLNESKVTDGYSIKLIQNSHEALRKRAVALMIANSLKKPVEARHIDLVDCAILKGQGKIELSKDLYISVNNDIITFQQSTESISPWIGTITGNSIETPFSKFSLIKLLRKDSENFENCFDSDKVSNHLTIRNRRSGDKFTDMKRHNTKSLKKLFNEKKIPLCQREKLAVFCDGDEIVYVENIGINKKYSVDSSTVYVTRIIREGN